MNVSDVPAFVVDEFWGRIDKTGDCWPWNGPQDGKGYGRRVWRKDGRVIRMLTHRLAYLLTYGSLPERPLILRHEVCGNPICCNPAHLAPGTYQDNADDRKRMGRNATGDRNGVRKHPETLLRGDKHPSRRYPERRPKGDNHWTRLHPERIQNFPHGDDNWTRKHPERVLRGEKHPLYGKEHPCHGAAHPSAKLDEDSVREIRRRYAEGGVSQERLGALYGVSQRTISVIVLGKAWKSVH